MTDFEIQSLVYLLLKDAGITKVAQHASSYLPRELAEIYRQIVTLIDENNAPIISRNLGIAMRPVEMLFSSFSAPIPTSFLGFPSEEKKSIPIGRIRRAEKERERRAQRAAERQQQPPSHQPQQPQQRMDNQKIEQQT
jgi:hypothetical protein